MKCIRPIDVSVLNGSREVISVASHRRVVYTRSSFLVPCGKCLACKSRRKSQLTFRMDCERRYGHFDKEGEIRRYKHSFFVTLSYAPRFLPTSVPMLVDFRTGECFDIREDESGLLCRRHFSEFMKRLRRYYNLDCKIFACGEYGDENNRPHYHFIFYSDLNWQDAKDAIRHAWSMSCPREWRHSPGAFVVESGKYRKWRFSFGRVDVKTVNIRRLRYVAKYVVKETQNEKCVPTFSSISNGLGSAWLVSEDAKIVRKNRLLYSRTSDFRVASLGRYYSHMLYTKSELQDAVDDFINTVESPPPGSEFGDKYKRWYDRHITEHNVLYRANLAKLLTPYIFYV